MADSFKNEIVRIDAIAEINPDKLDKSFKYKRMKYVDISSVDKGYITGYQDLSLEDAPSRAQRLTKVNDFIISTDRPGNRSYAYIKNSQEVTVFSTGFAVIWTRKCDPRYLYYVLTSDTIIDYLASIDDSKSAYPSINPSDSSELEIDLLPLETQNEIAHIIGTLDDKIELNRRMNKTLEEIAQTLYKQWYIDFEFPKEKGKPYKFTGGEMIDSELGLIPKGWRVGQISDISKKVCIGPFGSSIKVETFTDSGIPFISGQHLKEVRLSDTEYNFVTKERAYSISNSLVYRGDVIFTHAGSIGQVAYIPNTSKYETYIISQRQFYLRCDTEKMLPELVVMYFKTPRGQHNLLANTSSSGVPSISQPATNLKRHTILIPPIKVQNEYVVYLESSDRKVSCNLHNITLLENTKNRKAQEHFEILIT